MSDDSFKGIDWNKTLMLPEWEPVLEMLKEHRSETIRLACSNPMPNYLTIDERYPYPHSNARPRHTYKLKLKQFSIGDELTQEQKDSIDADRDSILGAIKLVEIDTATTWQLSGSAPELLKWTKRDSNGHFVPCAEDDPDKIEFGDLIYDLGNDRYSFSRDLFVAMLQVQVDKAVVAECEACAEIADSVAADHRSKAEGKEGCFNGQESIADNESFAIEAAEDIATQIRARGDK